MPFLNFENFYGLYDRHIRMKIALCLLTFGGQGHRGVAQSFQRLLPTCQAWCPGCKRSGWWMLGISQGLVTAESALSHDMQGSVTCLVSCGEDTHKKFSHHPILGPKVFMESTCMARCMAHNIFLILSNVHGTHIKLYTLVSPTVVSGPKGSRSL